MNKPASLVSVTNRYARRFQRTHSLFALVMCAVMAFITIGASATCAAAYNLLNRGPVRLAPVALGLTLTTPVLLDDVIDAFVTKFPLLGRIAADFAGQPLKLNNKYIAHVVSYGSASTYDPTTGYANGANVARNGLVDVPIVVDNQPTYPLKWLHLDEIKDMKNKYEKVMGGAGYVLGKKVIDDGIFAKATTRYFSYEIVSAVADFDYDVLQSIAKYANETLKMADEGRILVINSSVASVLAVDPRLISKDYAGKLQDGRGFRMWENVSGFALIMEYPDLPSNNGAQLTGVTGANSGDLMTKTAHGLVTGDPVTFISGTTFTGLTAGTRYFAIKASADTFQVALTYADAVAGTAVALSADGTSGVFQLQENLIGMAFDGRAFSYMLGAPEGIDSKIAAQMGIPPTGAIEPFTSAEHGISMAAAKWQEPGTFNLFWAATFIFGTNAGKQGDTAVAGNTAAANSILAAATARGSTLDKAGLRITSGASA